MSESARTADFFDRYAKEFSDIYGNRNTLINRIVNGLFRRSMRLRYNMVIEGCEPVAGRTALDIGSGPGHYSVELARRGASRVLGIDFADGMIDIARNSAARAGVEKTCEFARADFFKDEFSERFDYAFAMGFMDYVAEPEKTLRKAVELTKVRAFFSFPVTGGLLAWQRKLRYQSRCELYLYTEPQVRELFSKLPVRIEIRRIDRDLFVTAHRT